MTLQELLVKISTQFDGKGLTDASSQVNTWGAGISKQVDAFTGGIASKLAGAFALTAIVGGAVKGAETYEAALQRIQRATGATGAQLEGLGATFKNVYANSAAGAEEITRAMTMLTQRTGATGPALEELTNKVLKLSRIAQEDVGAVVAQVTRLFGDWSIATEKQGAAMDYLGGLSQKSGVAVSALSEQLVYAGAPLRMLGYNFEQAGALIAKFGQEGVNTELVLGGMKAALQKFAKEGITDTAGEWRRFVEGVRNGSITLQEVMAQVGAKRGPDLFRAIVEGRMEVQALETAAKQAAQATGTSVGTMRQEFTKLTHTVEMVLEPFGAPLMSALSAALEQFRGFAQEAGKILEDLGKKRPDDVPWYEGYAQNMVGAALSAYVRWFGDAKPGQNTAAPKQQPSATTGTAGDKGASEAAAGADTLIKKQGELEAAVTRAQAVWAEVKRRYDEGTASARDLTLAHDQLKKAIDAAAGSQKSQILTLGELTEKNSFLASEVAKAAAIYGEVEKRYLAGAASARELGAAHGQLEEAIKRAAKATGDHVLTVDELIAKQQGLNIRVMEANETFLQMQARYDAGTASASDLARAHEQLDAAIKAATGAGRDWLSVYQQIVNEQQEARESAYGVAKAYLEIAQNFAANSGEVRAAQARVVSAFRDTGDEGVKIWQRLVQEAGGYVVEVVNGSQKTQQALGLSQQQAEALGSVYAAIQGKAVETAGTMAEGVRKSTVLLSDGVSTVDMYVGHAGRGADAWNANAGAIADSAQEANGLNEATRRATDQSYLLADGFGTVQGSIAAAASGAYGLGAALEAAYGALNRMIPPMTEIYRLTTGSVLSLDLMGAALNGTPYETRWTPAPLGGAGLEIVGGPEGTTKISVPAKGGHPDRGVNSTAEPEYPKYPQYPAPAPATSATAKLGEAAEQAARKIDGFTDAVDTINQMVVEGFDREAIEEFARAVGVSVEWLEDGTLSVTRAAEGLTAAVSGAASAMDNITDTGARAAAALADLPGAVATIGAAAEATAAGALGFVQGIAGWNPGAEAGASQELAALLGESRSMAPGIAELPQTPEAQQAWDAYAAEQARRRQDLADRIAKAGGGTAQVPDVSWATGSTAQWGRLLQQLQFARSVVIQNNMFRNREDIDYLVDLVQQRM